MTRRWAASTVALTTTLALTAAAGPAQAQTDGDLTVELRTYFVEFGDEVAAPDAGWTVSLVDDATSAVFATDGPTATDEDRVGSLTGTKMSVTYEAPTGWWRGDCPDHLTGDSEGFPGGRTMPEGPGEVVHTACFTPIPDHVHLTVATVDAAGRLTSESYGAPDNGLDWTAEVFAVGAPVDGDLLATDTPDGDWDAAIAEIRTDSYGVEATVEGGTVVPCSDGVIREFSAATHGVGTFTAQPPSEYDRYHPICVLPHADLLVGVYVTDDDGELIPDPTIPPYLDVSVHDGDSTAAPTLLRFDGSTTWPFAVVTITRSSYTIGAVEHGFRVVTCSQDLTNDLPSYIQHGVGTFSRPVIDEMERMSAMAVQEGPATMPYDLAHAVCVAEAPLPVVTEEPTEDPTPEPTETPTPEPTETPTPTPEPTAEATPGDDVLGTGAERDGAPDVGPTLPATGLPGAMLPTALSLLAGGGMLAARGRRW